MAVACGQYHTLTLDDHGNVWGIGKHGYGQMGLRKAYIGKTLSSTIMKPIKLPLKNITSIACGDFYSICCDISGNVYVFGDNREGQLGVHGFFLRPDPCKLPQLHKILSVHSGKDHTICIDDVNDVYGFGNNSGGQLGLGNVNARISLPQKITSLSDIKTVSCGYKFSIFLNFSGELFACGIGEHASLGLGNIKNVGAPQQIVEIPSISLISSGKYHTLALSGDGELFSFGSNQHGQLGLGSSEARYSSPNQIENMETICFISCGAEFSMAVGNEGQVWTCGRNSRGQLGIGSKVSKSSFVPIEGLEGVQIGACGADFAVVKNGEGLWRFGSHPKAASANNYMDDYTLPFLMPATIASKIGLSRAQKNKVKSARK